VGTIVIKGDHFSNNDIQKLKTRKLKVTDGKSFRPTVKIVMVYPTGITDTFESSMILFNIINEMGDESIIYGKEVLDTMFVV
jgi:hypothetical protein